MGRRGVLEPRHVVEVDGGAHIGRARRDRERDAYLASYGVGVLRVKAWQVEVSSQGCSCASARPCLVRGGEREGAEGVEADAVDVGPVLVADEREDLVACEREGVLEDDGGAVRPR